MHDFRQLFYLLFVLHVANDDMPDRLRCRFKEGCYWTFGRNNRCAHQETMEIFHFETQCKEGIVVALYEKGKDRAAVVPSGPGFARSFEEEFLRIKLQIISIVRS